MAPAIGAEDAHDDERLHDRPARVDAGEVRRVGIAAVGVDVATEAPARGDERHDDADADEQDDRPGDAHRDAAALLGGSSMPRSSAMRVARRRWGRRSRWRTRQGRARPRSRGRRRGPRPTSAATGSRIAPLPAVVDDVSDDADAGRGSPRSHVTSPPSDPRTPPPTWRNVLSMPVTDGPLGEDPHGPAQGQQTTQRDHEGGHARCTR